MSRRSDDLFDPERPPWHSRFEHSHPRAHTHQSVDDIVRRLRIGPVERLLLWLSKTDYFVLALSTHHTRLTLASLGMMVVFTSTLAFFSALYVLMTALMSPDSLLRWPAGLLLALVYAFGIMIIDREIVGATSKKSLAIRLLFALLIATAVSWPVKLKFFEGRIDIEINRMIEEQNADKLERIEQLKNLGESERMDQRRLLLNRASSLHDTIESLQNEIDRERQIVECGPKCQNFINQKTAFEAELKQVEDKLAALAKPGALPERVEEEISQLQTAIKNERAVSYDFLTKWEALSRIGQSDQTNYTIISTFLFAFFLLLELVPLALKWSLGKTEYHYYIEARSNLTNQKLISITNEFMRMMQEDPSVALELPPEISDILAWHMEDEAFENREGPDLRGFFDSVRQRGTGPGRDEAPDEPTAPLANGTRSDAPQPRSPTGEATTARE